MYLKAGTVKLKKPYSLVHLVVPKLEMLISQSLLGVYSRSELLSQDRVKSQSLRNQLAVLHSFFVYNFSKAPMMRVPNFQKDFTILGSTVFVTEQIHVIQRNKSDHPNRCISMGTMVLKSRYRSTAN